MSAVLAGAARGGAGGVTWPACRYVNAPATCAAVSSRSGTTTTSSSPATPAPTRWRSCWLLCCTALLVLGWPSFAAAAPSPAPFPAGGGVVTTYVCEVTPAKTAGPTVLEPATPERSDCAATGYGQASPSPTPVASASPAPASAVPACPPSAPCVTTWDQGSTEILAGGFTLTLLLLSALLVAQLRSR